MPKRGLDNGGRRVTIRMEDTTLMFFNPGRRRAA